MYLSPIDTQPIEGKDNDQQQSPMSAISEEAQMDHSNCKSDPDSTLILLDWDDTLFPTSVICEVLENTNKNGLALIYDEQIELLHRLGTLTLDLLRQLIAKYGANNIHIVTNSLKGWIKNSLFYASCIANVYKEIEILLHAHDITMDSARSSYENKIKDDTPTSWKRLCFNKLLDGSKTASEYYHIISIGDQWADHDSIKQSIALLTDYAPTHHIIKLKMDPNLKDMIHETMYINTCFNQIFDVISTPNTPFYEHPKAVKPVFIDYYREEIKSHQMVNMDVDNNEVMLHMMNK